MLIVKGISTKKKIVYSVVIAAMALGTAGMIYRYYAIVGHSPASDPDTNLPSEQEENIAEIVVTDSSKEETGAVASTTANEPTTNIPVASVFSVFNDLVFSSLEDHLQFQMPEAKTGNKNIFK